MSHKERRITTVAYAVNGSGLGHLTRVLAVLRWMKRLARLSGVRLDAYILTSSEAPGLAHEEGFASFKIPSKTAVREAGLPKEDYLRLARQWVWHSLGLIKPDLLLVDTFPGGSFGELIHALDVPRARVFIHRAMKEEFAQSESVQALLPFYDRILIPVEPGSPAREIPARIKERTRYVGPIMLRSREEMRPRALARRRLGIPDGKLGVWLSAGGGGDAFAERAIHNLFEILSAESDLHLVVGAGPLYRGAPLRGPGITWLTGFHASEDFSGLDFAISAAGYNSFHELLHAGVPTIFFAQEKIADEQSRRVEAATAAGCAIGLRASERDVFDKAELRRAIAELRDESKREILAGRATEFVPTNDAREAAFEALSTLLPNDALEEAMELGTPQFFLDLARHGVGLDDVEWMLGRFKSANDLDADEQRELINRLLSGSSAGGQASINAFRALARCFPSPATEADAEELLNATLQVLAAAAPFEDERASLELLRMLPRDELQLTPASLAAAVCDFLNALRACGESIWRGKTLLARHLHESEAGSLIERFKAAAGELAMPRESKEANIEGGRGLLSGENYDTTFGD
jgi:predicted glycosyltransferase